MSTSPCAGCQAIVPSSAAFCPNCGRASNPNSTAPLFNPEAERAVRAATQSAKVVVANLGPTKTLAIIGGILGVLGCTLPYYASGFPSGFQMYGLSVGLTMSLLHWGSTGAIILILAIVLGAAPLLLVLSRSLALVGFGLSCAVLGEMLLGLAGFSYGVAVSYGVGFYCGLLGFGLLTYVYAGRARA